MACNHFLQISCIFHLYIEPHGYYFVKYIIVCNHFLDKIPHGLHIISTLSATTSFVKYHIVCNHFLCKMPHANTTIVIPHGLQPSPILLPALRLQPLSALVQGLQPLPSPHPFCRCHFAGGLQPQGAFTS